MENYRVQIPDDIVKEIKEKYCAGRKSFSGNGLLSAITSFSKRQLLGMDRELGNIVANEKNGLSLDTLYKALNQKKPYGVFCRGNRNLLDLLCYFTYEKSWLAVLNERGIEELDLIASEKEQQSEGDYYKELVRRACLAEFEAYQAVPEIKTDMLVDYFIDKSSAFNRIYTYLVDHAESGLIISNEHNPSDFEIYEMSVTRMTDEEVIIETQEYWLLQWYNTRKKKYFEDDMYNAKNRQTYKLVRIDGCWKIKSLFFPENKSS